MENIGTIILATGALGTAAFGIIEALKWTRLGEAGFGSILKMLGPILQTLEIAYGPDYKKLLRAQYRGNQRELTRLIRQGVRVGLRPENAAPLAVYLGIVDGAALRAAAEKVISGGDLSAELRNVLGRFELAVDARIDAALTLAQSNYAGATRVSASVVALAIAMAVGLHLGSGYWFQALLVGIAAVPLAPVAKDLVSALQAATRAIRTRA
ncbi:MAG TPA: hypothetical protein VNO43_02040 [Candidatus Eisenbacteria bacterium]|nr:hypothetical protein [Candidatus Eisenbacteria bacterium]